MTIKVIKRHSSDLLLTYKIIYFSIILISLYILVIRGKIFEKIHKKDEDVCDPTLKSACEYIYSHLNKAELEGDEKVLNEYASENINFRAIDKFKILFSNVKSVTNSETGIILALDIYAKGIYLKNKGTYKIETIFSKRINNYMKKCPNCGASNVDNEYCEYCNTKLYIEERSIKLTKIKEIEKVEHKLSKNLRYAIIFAIATLLEIIFSQIEEPDYYRLIAIMIPFAIMLITVFRIYNNDADHQDKVIKIIDGFVGFFNIFLTFGQMFLILLIEDGFSIIIALCIILLSIIIAVPIENKLYDIVAAKWASKFKKETKPNKIEKRKKDLKPNKVYEKKITIIDNNGKPEDIYFHYTVENNAGVISNGQILSLDDYYDISGPLIPCEDGDPWFSINGEHLMLSDDVAGDLYVNINDISKIIITNIYEDVMECYTYYTMEIYTNDNSNIKALYASCANEVLDLICKVNNHIKIIKEIVIYDFDTKKEYFNFKFDKEQMSLAINNSSYDTDLGYFIPEDGIYKQYDINYDKIKEVILEKKKSRAYITIELNDECKYIIGFENKEEAKKFKESIDANIIKKS